MTATITKAEQHTLFEWPCDDDRDGFVFKVVQASDGDFWLSIEPAKTHPEREMYKACYCASMRVRMPMIGGGQHDALWQGLQAAVSAEREAAK